MLPPPDGEEAVAASVIEPVTVLTVGGVGAVSAASGSEVSAVTTPLPCKLAEEALAFTSTATTL